MVTVLATILDDTSKVVPIGGIAALLAMMLRMVWVNDKDQRLYESRLRTEFEARIKAEDERHAADLARIRAEYDSYIGTLKTVQDAEIESLNRRIKLLREEASEKRP